MGHYITKIYHDKPRLPIVFVVGYYDKKKSLNVKIAKLGIEAEYFG